MMLRLIVLAFTIALGNAAPIEYPPRCADWCDNEKHKDKVWKHPPINGPVPSNLSPARCDWLWCSGCSPCLKGPG